MSQPPRHSRRRRRRILVAALVLVMVGAVLGIVALHDVRGAQAALEQSRAELTGVADTPESLSSAEGRRDAGRRLRGAAQHVRQARHLLRRDPALSLAALVPVVRTQRQGLLGLVDDAATAVASGRSVLDQLDTSAEALHLRQGNIPLDRLDALAATARASGQRMAALNRPSRHLWQPLRQARERFDSLDQRVATRLVSAGDGLRAGATFLGAKGPRHYFLALENNAEMRDRGMTLSYGTMGATGGHLSVGHTGRIAELELTRPAPTPVPPGTASLFAEIGPTQLWQSTTAGPDFAFSGRAMVDMYHQATGQTVDGVVAVDVPGLAALLDVIGPVQVPGVATPITSANAAQVLLHDLYAADTSDTQSQRIEHLGDVASAIVERLTHGDVDTISLARHLSAAAGGAHIKLYSTDATEEATFEQATVGGGPALVLPDRTFHVAVESRLSSKVDYYVQSSIHQDVSVVANGDAIVQTSVTVANTAPTGPPSEQLGPDRSQPGQVHAVGDYIAWILCWSPAGSSQPGAVAESGLQAAQRIELFHAGETRAVTFAAYIPHAVRDGRLQLRYVPQPRLTPAGLTVTVTAADGRHLGQPFSGPLDRTRVLSWDVAGH